MIFKIDKKEFQREESYKERNLYYKIFAGYLFNELVPGEEIRKQNFIDLLIRTSKIPDRCKFSDLSDEILESQLRQFALQAIQVTFDYHSSQVVKEDKKVDRGEMSDILLITENQFISIECKYLSDMDYSKDIETVQKRIQRVNVELNKSNPLQVLILKESKWENAKKASKKEYGFYAKMQNGLPIIPIIVLFWEDLIKIIENETVSNYLKEQLLRAY
jgi:hypothetical protein